MKQRLLWTEVSEDGKKKKDIHGVPLEEVLQWIADEIPARYPDAVGKKLVVNMLTCRTEVDDRTWWGGENPDNEQEKYKY